MKTFLKIRNSSLNSYFNIVENNVDCKNKQYQFDGIFNDDNKQLFASEIEPILNQIMQTKNSHHAIVTYGCTSSGKTHTMQNEGDGIIPSSFDFLFSRAKLETEENFLFKIKCVEIYMERCNDLLPHCTPASMLDGLYKPPLRLFATPSANSDANFSKLSMDCSSDYLALLQNIFQRRQISSTKANEISSRSHLLIFVDIYKGEDVFSRLTFADLAGSERYKNTKIQDLKQIQEAGSINKSLHTFHNVIHAIREKRAHIPIRDSKLTHMLGRNLLGAGNLHLIITINTDPAFADETIHVLEFGAIVRQVEPLKSRVDTGKSILWSVKKRLDFLKIPEPEPGSPLRKFIDDSYDWESSIEQFIKDRENAIRAEMTSEHAENSDKLRTLYESILEDTSAETEEKFNRKMDVIARSYEAELSNYARKVENLETTIRKKDEFIEKLQCDAFVIDESESSKTEYSQRLSLLIQDHQAEREMRKEMNLKEVSALKEEYLLKIDDLEREIDRLKLQLVSTSNLYQEAILDLKKSNDTIKAKNEELYHLNKSIDDYKLQVLRHSMSELDVYDKHQDDLNLSPIKKSNYLAPNNEDIVSKVRDSNIQDTASSLKEIQIITADNNVLPINADTTPKPLTDRTQIFSQLGLNSAFKISAPKNSQKIDQENEDQNKSQAEEGLGKRKVKLRKKRANFESLLE